MHVKVRFRALVIAIVVLVLLDVTLRLPFVRMPIPAGYRMPSRGLMGYDQLIKSMSQQPGVRVAVVGDSIVRSSFALPTESLSEYLEKELDERGLDNQSYNLGLVAAKSSDLMPVIANVAQAKAADVIVVNYDYRFYKQGKKISYFYPELYDKVDWSKLPVPAELTRPPASVTPTPTAQERGDAIANSAWKLFSLRDYLMIALFDGTPQGWLANTVARAKVRAAGDPIWAKKAPEKLPLDRLRTMFAVGPLDKDNTYIRFLGAAIDAAKSQGVPIVVFAGPLDLEIMNGQNLWNPAEYATNIAFVKRFVEERGGIFYDYTQAVPGKDLLDSHHPLAPGYHELASVIASDIAPIVESAETSRNGVR